MPKRTNGRNQQHDVNFMGRVPCWPCSNAYCGRVGLGRENDILPEGKSQEPARAGVVLPIVGSADLPFQRRCPAGPAFACKREWDDSIDAPVTFSMSPQKPSLFAGGR